MKIIKNKIIPFKGFSAMMFLGYLWTRKEVEKIDKVTINHESIHSHQERELGYVFFWIWYVIEYIVRFIQYRNFNTAYKEISFEREAYGNEKNEIYLALRENYSFLNYLKK